MLVGREVVLTSIDAALAQALSGRGRLLFLAGEAGIGKTAIAQAVAVRASAGGAVLRWGACSEAAARSPFAVWADCLRRPAGDACAQMARRFLEGSFDAGPDAHGAARQRARLFSDVVDALHETASSRAQVLVLEDLHWADTHSLELLRAVATKLPSMPVLVVATYRDDELDPIKAQLHTGGNAETIALEGLREDEVGVLLGDLLGRAPTDQEVHTVFERTGGNPLFVTQVGRLVASGSSTVLPGGVRDVLSRRLARLSPECVRVLGAAAVLGGEFDTRTVAAVLDEPEGEVLAALDNACDARLVAQHRSRPAQWAFAHALISEAAADVIGPGQRRELHRRAVDVLYGAPRIPAGALAHHVAQGRFDADDPRPATIMIEASRDALVRFAWHEAQQAAEDGLDRAPPGPPGDTLRAEAWLALGDARLRGGDEEGAATAFGAATEIAERLADSDLVARAALGFAAGLDGFEVRVFDDRQVQFLEGAAAALPADAPMRPLVLARLSVALSFVGSNEGRLALADEAVALARARHDDRAIAVALAARCDALAGPDHVTERLGVASEIVALARRVDDDALELLGRRMRVVALLELRDEAGFDAEVLAYDRVAAQLGDPLYSWYVPLWRATRAYAQGRLEEARGLVAEARGVGELANSFNAFMLSVVHSALVALDSRDGDEIERTWSAFGVLDQFAEPSVLVFRALIDARLGARTRARNTLERLGPEILQLIPLDQEWLASAGQLVESAVEVGLDDAARDAYAALLPYEDLDSFEGIAAYDHGLVGQYLALAAGYLGEYAAALRHTERVLARSANAGAVVLAHTRANCARGLLATDDDAARARGHVLAQEAIAAYDEVGLRALADELRALAGETRTAPPAATLAREGETWAFTYAGTTTRLRHAKGIADLAVLLARPGREVHVRDLEGVAATGVTSEQPLLDEEAVARYRARVIDLDTELEAADRDGDAGRSASLTAERDALVEQLRAAYGLGDRRRGFVDADERLRKAVSARVKASIDRIAAADPALGAHLRHSVRTGFFCVYEPEHAVVWQIDE